MPAPETLRGVLRRAAALLRRDVGPARLPAARGLRRWRWPSCAAATSTRDGSARPRAASTYRGRSGTTRRDRGRRRPGLPQLHRRGHRPPTPATGCSARVSSVPWSPRTSTTTRSGRRRYGSWTRRRRTPSPAPSSRTTARPCARQRRRCGPTGAVVGQQFFGGARGFSTNHKAGSKLNLVRWVSARTVRETFSLPATPIPPHGRGKGPFLRPALVVPPQAPRLADHGPPCLRGPRGRGPHRVPAGPGTFVAGGIETASRRQALAEARALVEDALAQ